MLLGTEVGLGPGHIVLDGDPVTRPPKGAQNHFSAHVYCGQNGRLSQLLLSSCALSCDNPAHRSSSLPPYSFTLTFSFLNVYTIIVGYTWTRTHPCDARREANLFFSDFFGRPFVKRFALYAIGPLFVCLSVLSCLWRWCIVAKRLMDQGETWYAGRPRLWPHCVRRRPSSRTPLERGTAASPLFGPYLLWPRSPISATAELLLLLVLVQFGARNSSFSSVLVVKKMKFTHFNSQ